MLETVTRPRGLAPAVLALWLGSCGGSPPRPNVVLISIDTLRADHVGAYGYPGGATPHIDELARGGVRFARVLSPAPLTLPAHSSMLTGHLPPRHGIHDNLSYRLSDDATTLAELLRDEGYVTGAVVSSFVLDSRFNLDQGFETYADDFEEEHRLGNVSERKGDETTRFALGWLAERAREESDHPFFLFVHYYDPHDDYAPPEPFSSRFREDPYAGEVAFADAQVGEIVKALLELDFEDDTIVVVTGDHGEMLGEHGEPTHGFFVYQSALRVPLIVRGPSIEPRIVEPWVGLADVAPTIAGLAGLELPAPLDGHDLSGLVRAGDGGPGAGSRRDLLAESLTPSRYYGAQALHALVVERWKYIHTARPELYDIEADPGEANDVLSKNPEIAAGMKRRIEQILLDARAEDDDGAEAAELDAEARARLAALGYLGGGGAAVSSGSTPMLDGEARSDPKDWIEFHADHQRLEELVRARSYDEAAELAGALLARHPGFAAGHIQLARIASERGEIESAAAHYERALELEPDDAGVHYNLGNLLRALGRTQEALEHLRRATAIDPELGAARDAVAATLVESGSAGEAVELLEREVERAPRSAPARVKLARALARAGRIDEALARLDEARVLAPSSSDVASAHHQIGLAFRARGDDRRALEQFDRALGIDPMLAVAHDDRGLALKSLGREDEALAAYRSAVEADPELASAHNNIGSLLGARRDIDGALRSFRRAVELDPSHAEARNNLGLALRMTGARDEAVPHFRAALALRPEWARPLNELAWILATHPDAARRDPPEAVRLAERAVALEGEDQPVFLDTLAAAYAANGDFHRAASTAERAVELASRRAPGLAAEIGARLEGYRRGRAFREPRAVRAAPR